MWKNVYLAGRIEGLTFEQAADWRNLAAARFDEEGIDCYNPCDHVPLALRNGIITTENVRAMGGFRADEIFAQDVFHLQNCNVFLVNLNNPRIGTLIELGIAYTLQLTIVGFGGSPDLRKHPFIYKTIQVMFDSLDEAVDFIINL